MQRVASVFILALILPLVLIIIRFVLGPLIIENSNKKTRFECGFENFNIPRLRFKILYYKVVLIFVVFDLEISLFAPLIYLNFNSLGIYSLILVLIILVLGLSFEIRINSFE